MLFRSPRKLPGDLREVLLRERSRADRTDSEFCLVWFAGQQLGHGVAQVLHAKLRARIRLTDYVDFAGDGSVWLVLVDCPVEACLKLIREIQESAAVWLRELEPVVYHYPGQWHDIHEAHLCPPTPARRDQAVTPSGEPSHSQLAPRAQQACNRVQPLNPLLEIRLTPLKRCVDVFAASLGLLFFAPLLVIIAAAIRCESPGPAIFAQQRLGRGHRRFKMYKFRTMVVNAEGLRERLAAFNEQDGPAFKIARDPRITRCGRWLRASSLDELPQLWNVLRGEMSLVGPRPLPVGEGEQCLRWQRHREAITPGMTCLWQVQDQRNKLRFDEWVRLDLRYIREISAWVDLKLLARTAVVALRRRGI